MDAKKARRQRRAVWTCYACASNMSQRKYLGNIWEFKRKYISHIWEIHRIYMETLEMNSKYAGARDRQVFSLADARYRLDLKHIIGNMNH